jgi:CHAT domain-containing protein
VNYVFEEDEKAINYYKEAMEIRRLLAGEYTTSYMASLSNLATVYKVMGKYYLAEEMFLKALSIQAKLKTENDAYANCLNNLGNLYLDMGLIHKAEIYKLQAVNVCKRVFGTKHDFYARAVSNLSSYYRIMGNPDKALQFLKESLEIVRDKLGEEHELFADVIGNLAFIYKDKPNFHKESEKLFIQAMAIYKKSYKKNANKYQSALNELCFLYISTGKYKKSEELLISSMEDSKEYYSKNKNLEYLITNIYLGITYTEVGRHKEAEEIYNQLQKLHNVLLDINSTYFIEYVNQVLRLNEIKQNNQKLLPTYIKQNESILKQISNNFPTLSENEKLNYYKTVKNYLANYQSFAIRVHQQKNLSNFPQKSLDSLKANLLDLQLATKGILLHSSQKMKTNILNSQDSSLIALFGQWEKQKQQVIDYEKLSLADKAKNKLNIDSLAEATNNIEKQLSAKSENFATTNDKRKYTWQDIQQALKPNEVAVEMVRISKFGVEKVLTDSSDTEYFKQKGFYPKYDRYGLTDTTYYAALLVSKHTKNAPELVILENGNDLENKHLLAYQKGIKEQHSPEGKFPHSPEGEYTAFWAKIANSKTLKSMQGRAKIYFSPDGVYHKINLNTLYNAKTKKYVLDAFDIQQVTNLKEIISTPQKPVTNNKEIVLLGFPNYELENKARYEVAEKQKMARKVKAEVAAKIATVLPVSIEKITAEMIGNDSTSIATNRTSNRGEIGKLLQTREEVKTIAYLAQKNEWQPALYLENEALEETVKSVNSPRILHIATHGFFNANVEEGKNANPLLRSGLLLAGAAQTLNGKEPITIESLSAKEQTEDGILTAYEVMNLNLDKTDLVVLSACETGLGEVSNGEGVYGLQRAFMVAGAKALIISLWKVDDAATSELMTSFYENYLKIGNKRKAFEQAQQALRKNKDYQNPFYWGAFVMVGE